jgi:pimeloyl-ACP methyl ester carboxylesterase
MYKRLIEYFTVICIDHLGMGASSRPKNYDKNVEPQESIDYFVEYLEKWRVQFSKHMGKELTDFYLVGHSFGAYIAGHYCLKYHQYVKKLLLLSPVGIRVTQSSLDFKESHKLLEEEVKHPGLNEFPPQIRLMLKVVWQQKISPYDVCRVAGESFAMKIINAYVNRRLTDDYARHVVAAYTY